MGQQVASQAFTRGDRTRFRRKHRHCLDALTGMLAADRFVPAPACAGLEVEFHLVDDQGLPACQNEAVLIALSDPAFQAELGRFNIEVNVAPRRLDHGGFTAFAQDLAGTLDRAERRASELGAHLVMVGILPTLSTEHLSAAALSPNPRFDLLNEQILLSRGEDITLHIEGEELLSLTTDSIIFEAACTSTQLHLQVSPAEFPAHWNAAQAIAGIQVAVCANAPYLVGRELWRETRTQLFEQAVDTRSDELKAQGVRPRTWFGERWITSVLDLFEENARFFPALLPVCAAEEPVECLAAGGLPALAELRLHNGTIWRWNRPVYDVVAGQPHLRVENRVLPSGPTLVDILANAAFFFGLVRSLATAEQPVWRQMPFDAAAENFTAGARHGIDACVYWPGTGPIEVAELVVRTLVPLAYEGLAALGVDHIQSQRLLEIIEERCLRLRNGATWQVAMVHHLSDRRGLDRGRALQEMVRVYAEHMWTDVPVHSWPLPGS